MCLHFYTLCLKITEKHFNVTKIKIWNTLNKYNRSDKLFIKKPNSLNTVREAIRLIMEIIHMYKNLRTYV